MGGRFSVLSSVGLLPAALTGMDVAGLLAGAADMAAWIKETSGWDNPACAFAGVQYLNDVEFDRRISVMMPYSAHLRDIADWYRQLWAESLGKTVDRQGRTVNVGPTPVKSLGVTDQHSQLQLYAEGPDDKIITFLGVGEFAQTIEIPAPGPEAGRPVLSGRPHPGRAAVGGAEVHGLGAGAERPSVAHHHRARRWTPARWAPSSTCWRWRRPWPASSTTSTRSTSRAWS